MHARPTTLILLLIVFGCSRGVNPENEVAVKQIHQSGIKTDTTTEFRSRIGNSIVLPSQWTAEDKGDTFILTSPDSYATINIFSFTVEGSGTIADFRELMVAQVPGEWKESEWEEVDFDGVPGQKRRLTSVDENAEAAWCVYVLQTGQFYHALILRSWEAMMVLNGGFYEECIRSFKGVSETQ